jgi:DNA-binding LacI/PurR family transcriptional regulator
LTLKRLRRHLLHGCARKAKPVSEVKSRSFVSAQMVAERAGVSRSAVSRTFTDGASVSEATRRKVLSAASELGYHVNHLARGLIQDRSNIVCLIVADMITPIRARMVDALTRRLQAIDKVAMVINTETDTESVSAALRQTLHYRADATVVLSGTPSASLVKTCIANGQRVVLINRDDHLPDSENIGVDNELAAREAFFLLRRAGCRRLAVVSSAARTASLLERERAFVAAAEAEGLKAGVTRAGPTSYDSGVEAARRLFGRSQGPDGVFCVTDLIALGFMDAARQEFGLRIPEDLCVVGFDDIEQANWGSYRLTTFSQPVDEMADHVARLLDGSLAADPRKVFEPQPVWRRSVRPHAR